MTELIDLATARPTGKPNCCLVLPKGWGTGPAHRESPAFNADATTLAQAASDLLASTPRTEILARSPDGLQIEAAERSRLFRFVDRISLRAVPAGTDRSSVALFSRSLVGYWDLGVNRKRVERLLERLGTSLNQGTR